MSKNATTQRERDKKIMWLRTLREKTQHYSVVPRPQRVRIMWVTDISKREER